MCQIAASKPTLATYLLVKLHIVPARAGIQWVKLGVQTFLKQPLALAGLFFMYMAVVLVLSQVPVIGQLLGAMLVPAATLGLMAATAEATKGRFPMPTVLLSAFRAGHKRARAMLVLGALYTVGSVAITFLGTLLAGTPPAPPPAGATAAAQIDGQMVVVLLLHMPLVILFWHAPALVHWHDVPPVRSLFFSAVACFRNFGAMLMYGITWMGLFLAIAFAFSTIGLVVGGVSAMQSVLLPILLLMIAMFTTSLYFTFRDSFVETADGPMPPSPGGETP